MIFDDKKLNRQFMRLVLTMIAIMVATVGSCTYFVFSQVEKAGGVKQIAIDVGKNIKDIENEIIKHETP